MAYNPDLSYGGSGSKFGHQDYIGNLKSIWDQGGDGRQRKLMQARKDMLSWMGQAENVDKIADTNVLSKEGGLGQQISAGELTHVMPGVTNPEGKDWIGHADLYHGRASGHSYQDILSYLDQNPGKLRGNNPKGKGGLYDEVATEARFEKTTGDWTEALGGLQDQFTTGMQDQTDQLSGAFETGMGGVSDAITAQTASADKYRADQANWQRRQENMQQMMIQEGRRKAKEKPVMAVMPGASSYGGGGGGASSFARKKKQTTGLNIA